VQARRDRWNYTQTYDDGLLRLVGWSQSYREIDRPCAGWVATKLVLRFGLEVLERDYFPGGMVSRENAVRAKLLMLTPEEQETFGTLLSRPGPSCAMSP